MDIQAFWNGSFLPIGEIRVSPLDRGFLFGDGVYEVVRIYDRKPWLLNQHLRRLALSLEAIRIHFKVDPLRDVISRLVAEMSGPNASLYIQVTRGAAATRGHAFPQTAQPSVFAYLTPLDQDPADPLRATGARAILLPDERWANPHIKSLNLLPNCLAKQKAVECNAFEAIFFDSQQEITEGSSSNVFAVIGGEVMTPPSDGRILAGVTRAEVIRICVEHRIPIRESALKVDELLGAEEAFITGTMSELMPITRIDEQVIGDGRPGAVTSHLHRIFRDRCRAAAGDHS